MTKRILFYLLLISILHSSSSISASDILLTNYLTSENLQNEQMYGYNNKYTHDQWLSLSQAKRNEELQIPEEVFKSLDTKELFIECFSHPFIAAFGAFVDSDKPSEGFNHLRSKFIAFDHLIQRADLTEVITELYTSQKSPLINPKTGNISEEQRGSVNVFITDIINVPEIIKRFSKDQINTISLRAIAIDQEDKHNDLYRIALRYDTIFRIDKVYKRVAEVYNIDVTIPERLTNYLLLIEELEAIKKLEILSTKEEQKTSATRISYPTRWGQSSMSVNPTTGYSSLDQVRIDYLNNHYSNAFPHAVRLSEPTNKFNCHAYSLFSYDGVCEFFVSGVNAAAVLNTNDNNYFTKTYSPYMSFPINYTLIRWGDGSNTNHTGVLYNIYSFGGSGRPDYMVIKSKWGEAGIYMHGIDDCEYTGTISYYYRS